MSTDAFKYEFVTCAGARMHGRVAKGRTLTTIGYLYGAHRRWSGTEPDFIFRPRLLKLIAKRQAEITADILACLTLRKITP